MHAIEKNLPPPERPARNRFRAEYPWRELEVGDSFVHPGKRTAATALMWYAARQTGFRFRSRKEGTGYRIWRIA